MFSYGEKFRITLYGSSHEKVLGIIIDGLKPGLTIDFDKIKDDLIKRNPKLEGTTSRKEIDEMHVLTGIFNGYTTGAPVNIMIENLDKDSKDYQNLSYHFRPNHADFVANEKYNGFNDYRGGGFFSGRMTALLVIAGQIAKQVLPYKFDSELVKIGDLENIAEIDSYLEKIRLEQDSVGGIVKVRISNVKVGIGDPYFNKIDAKISHLIMTIPGVRGIIFGDSFDVSNKGSKNNDLIISNTGTTKTNHSGGITGGISNGNDIVFNVYVKPTSSIGIKQETYNFQSNEIESLTIKGRHDVAFVRRLPIVLESVAAIVLANY